LSDDFQRNINREEPDDVSSSDSDQESGVKNGAYVEGSYNDWALANTNTSGSYQSYSSDWLVYIQGTLDVVGLVPGIGEVADGVNALIYLEQGDLRMLG
jgi:hypothetical protein